MKTGITIAGNIIVDNIKQINNFPNKGMLANILNINTSVGGCVPNTTINLATLGGIPIKACGLIGNDGEGIYIKNQLLRASVNIDNIITVNGKTSFTDVMSQDDTKERTFFSYNGVNKIFGPNHIEESALNCKIIHFGYLLLLDSFDAYDKEYGTIMAHFLADLQTKGIKTSIDVVTIPDAKKFQKIVIPALKYCDYVIINEIEAGFIANINPRANNGKILIENIDLIAKKILSLGAKKVFIHCPEAGFGMDENELLIAIPSHDLPKEYIVGTVGAGDAFCAGILYSLYHEYSINDALVLATCCATANLSSDSSTAGALNYEKTLEIDKIYPRRRLKF